MDSMRNARHIGKNVIRMPPLARGGLRPDRTYLVTGGLGGIGCAVARWLVAHGAGAIVLNGRRDPDPEADETIRELRETGAEVRVDIADVTDIAAVDEMLARIDEGPRPLGGVIHSVGVLSDGVIENQSWERFEEVLWPKVVGGWHLHQATRSRDLDLFVLFSSVTGVVGNPGQSNHAAANAFLDQLAAHRRALGLPGQAIAWGAWSDIGEAEEHRERIERQLADTGAGWMTPEQGMEALDRLVRQDATAPTVAAIDWTLMAEGSGVRSPFLDDLLVKTKTRQPTAADSAATGLMAELREAPTDEKRNLLASFIRQELKAVLRLSSSPSPTAGFFDLGMDSLMAVELRNRLNRALAGEYTASNTIVFDHPSVAELARHLAEEIENLTGAPRGPERPAREPRAAVRVEHDGIAIVGMACRFPGAPDLPSFWEQLLAGADLVTEGRSEFHSWHDLVGDPAARNPAYRWGGYVGGLDEFDARFFGIRPIEAEADGPPAENAPGDDLAGAGGCRHRSGRPPGQQGRSVRRPERERVPRPDDRKRQGGRLLRHDVEHRCRPHRLHPGPDGTGGPLRTELRGVAGSRPWSGHGARTGRGGPGGGRRSQRDPVARVHAALDRTRHAVAGRPVRDVRRLGARLRPRRGLRGRRPQAPSRGRGGRRPDLGRDPRLGRESQRHGSRLDDSERTRPGTGDRRRAPPGRDRAGGRRLPGSSRYRVEDGRSHRSPGCGRGLRPGTAGRTAPAHGYGEDEHGPPGDGGRHRGTDQGRPRDAPRCDSEAPALRDAEPRRGLGSVASAGHVGDDGLAARKRSSSRCRRERLRALRRERPRHRGGLRRCERRRPMQGGPGTRRTSDFGCLARGRSGRRDAAERGRASSPSDAAPASFRQVGRGLAILGCQLSRLGGRAQ